MMGGRVFTTKNTKGTKERKEGRKRRVTYLHLVIPSSGHLVIRRVTSPAAKARR
jgi:hypothetical protein